MFKQMAMDIEMSLPVGQSEMHVGYIQYSATANDVFSLTDSFDPFVSSQNIWASKYTGGASCAANGLAAVQDMFTASGSANYPRAVVFFTDGPDSLAAVKANAISLALKQNNVDMYVVRKYALLHWRMTNVIPPVDGLILHSFSLSFILIMR